MRTPVRAWSRSTRIGSPSVPRTYSPTRSAPAASESGNPPENRVVHLDDRHVAVVDEPLQVQGALEPHRVDGPRHLAARTAGSANVSPVVLVPAFVASRHRGTHAVSSPSRSTRTSAVNSSPRTVVCTIGTGVRRQAQVQRRHSSTRYTSREPRPKRGFTIHGPGTPAPSPSPVAGVGTPRAGEDPAANFHLSRHTATLCTGGSHVATPRPWRASASAWRAQTSSAELW